MDEQTFYKDQYLESIVKIQHRSGYLSDNFINKGEYIRRIEEDKYGKTCWNISE